MPKRTVPSGTLKKRAKENRPQWHKRTVPSGTFDERGGVCYTLVIVRKRAGGKSMTEIERLKEIVEKLRAQDGCPWDRAQTHESLKPECIEEAAEVICGINILKETGNSENLREELGDLLLQVMFHAVLAEEEGLFTFEDVARTVNEKMIRRHPHVFGGVEFASDEERHAAWEKIKKQEKAGREWEKDYLPEAFCEANELIGQAKKRKGFA